MQKSLSKGTFVPLVTPFTASGNIDFEALNKLLNRLLLANVEALVVLGTTGESPTVSAKENDALIEHVTAHASGLAKVIAGVGSNDTRSSITRAKRAMDMGVDGLLVVCPYYSRPTQNGVYEHFQSIAEQVPLPQIVYSIAARTGINIEPETLWRLAELDAIVGVKESSGDIEQISSILQNVPDEFLVLSGCDHLNFATLCLGGSGVVSTVANLIPERVKSMVDAAFENDLQTARKLHFQMQSLVTGSSLESNPIPVKTALAASVNALILY